jgi:hypothetical protein
VKEKKRQKGFTDTSVNVSSSAYVFSFSKFLSFTLEVEAREH